MIWDIVEKIKSGEELSKSEGKELIDFLKKKLGVRKIETTFSGSGDYIRQEKEEYSADAYSYFIKAVKRGYFDGMMSEKADAPDREAQLQNEIGKAVQNEFINKKISHDERVSTETDIYVQGPDQKEKGPEVRSDAENSESNEPEETAIIETDINKFVTELYDQLVDFVEESDGRAGKIKRFYKRDERYKNYRQENNDNKWVDELLANERLMEEGDLALNFAIFFPWWWRETIVKESGRPYVYKDYISYVAEKTGGELIKNTSTESNRAERILDCIREFCNKFSSYSKYAIKFATIFLDTLQMEFEERMPEILEKIRKTGDRDTL